jgi:hypothetical protein
MSNTNLAEMAREMRATAPPMDQSRSAEIKATYSVSEFVKQSGFTSVSKMIAASKTNGQVSGFFVTFLNANKPQEEQATNVWFSLNASKDLAEGLVIEKGFFNDYQVLEMQYSDGEIRTKLCLKGEGRYSSIEDVL